MKIKMIYTLMMILLLSACEKEVIEYVDVPGPTETIIETVTETVTITETVTDTVTVTEVVPFPPDSYSFTREGLSTVSYGGQTARVKMAQELASALNDPSFTSTQLDAMFNDGTGFADASLDESGKTIGSKVSSYGSATVKPMFDAFITDVTENVFPAVNADPVVLASAGVAGRYTDAGGSNRTVYVNGKGLEINQAFTKGIIGGMAADQIISGYLSASKLDGGTNVEDNNNGVYAYTAGGATENNATKMEHYWDEGFGYLYGLEPNPAYPQLGYGVLLNKYLKKVDASDEPGIADVIYNAFKLGRAAIVAQNYELRDEQAEIVKVNLSKIIGYKAAYYLRSGATEITSGNWANAFHALSEGYGFVLSLQFGLKADGTPYMTNAEVNTILDALMEGNGFWDITPEALNALADQVDAATGLN